VPVALRALVSVGGDQFISALTGNDYVSFVLTLLVIFGISFELPLLVVMLNRAGVLRYTTLRRWRRGIIFVLFVFAAIVTPGGDPFSMIGLAGALAILFEVAVQLSRLHDRGIDFSEPEIKYDTADEDASEEEIARFNERLRAMEAQTEQTRAR
jgi:sec-independent protein translocase protein TatC